MQERSDVHLVHAGGEDSSLFDSLLGAVVPASGSVPHNKFFICHLHGHDGLLKISGQVIAIDPMFKDAVVDHIKGLLYIKADHMDALLGVFSLSYCLSKAQGGHVWQASLSKAELGVMGMITVTVPSGYQQGVFVYLIHCRCDRDTPVISRFERVLSFRQDYDLLVCSEGVWGAVLVSWERSLVMKNAVKYVCYGRCENVTGGFQKFGSQISAICHFIRVEFSGDSFHHGRGDVGVGCDV